MMKMPPQAYTKEVLAAAFDWLAAQPDYVREKITSADDLVGLYLKSTRLKAESKQNLSSAKNFRNELQDLAQNLKQFEEKPSSNQNIKEESVPSKTSKASSANPRSISVSKPLEASEMIGSSTASQDFSDEKNGSASSDYRPSPSQQPQYMPQSMMPNSHAQEPLPVPAPPQSSSQAPNPRSSSPSNTSASGSSNSAEGSTKTLAIGGSTGGEIFFKVDQKTQAALDMAKDRLNLSSDSEALRVLVSLGEKHLKKLFGNED